MKTINVLFLIALVMPFCFSKLKKTTQQIHNAQATNVRANSDIKSLCNNLDPIYITLVKDGPEDNYSSYKVPTRKPWGASDSDVKTVWSKLRFDPKTMLVHTGDFTFSKSVGYVGHHKSTSPDKIPFGSAFGCESSSNADAKARIDFRGTNFAVDDNFATAGWQAAGRIVVSNNNQVVEIYGGGYCGWTVPERANQKGEEAASAGGWFLKLKHIETATFVDPENGFTYIRLHGNNFSGYKVPTRKPWGTTDTDVNTKWTAVRFDPENGLIHTGDFKYSTSVGFVGHHKSTSPDKIPFGSAFGCESSFVKDGKARIDLTGTPFAIDDTFAFGGWQAAGDAVVSSNGQVVDIQGGGYCGWMVPANANKAGEENASKGGWYLKVKLLQ
jgi:hypothetical protein